MPLPSNDKEVGDIGHADDHNAIVNEINSLIAASANYLPASASSNFILASSSAALATSIISTIVDSAPNTLDTLNELAAALGDDPNFAASTASAIGERLTIANASATYLLISASSNYLPVSASSNYLPTSASSNYLPISASNNFAPLTISTNAQTGTSYTLALSDAGKIIEMNNAGANLVIIPLNSTAAFPVGTKIDIIQTGAGATSASTVSGVTLNSDTNKRTINTQWSAASLVKRATDTWIMIGAIKA